MCVFTHWYSVVFRHLDVAVSSLKHYLRGVIGTEGVLPVKADISELFSCYRLQIVVSGVTATLMRAPISPDARVDHGPDEEKSVPSIYVPSCSILHITVRSLTGS